MAHLEPLSFEQFQQLLADLLQIDPARLPPHAHWIADVGLDSLRIVQLLLQLEQRGLPLVFERAWEIQTVADAYRYYQENVPAAPQ
jgi:acyl carrier protein